VTEVSRKTGLSRESLYKALSVESNPEFATILKVMRALGLTITARAGLRRRMKTHRKITRQQMWEREYRAIRYLENMSESELKLRWEVIVDNSLRVVPMNGKLGIAPEPGHRWLELSTHVLEEAKLRNRQFMEIFSKPEHTGFAKKIELDDDRDIFKIPEVNSGTFKLGQYDHLKNLRDYGMLRLTPASHYGKSNYGYSIDDNELEKFVQLNQNNSEIPSILDGFSLHEFIKYNIRIPIKAATDYYLFCMARSFRYRHVFDFDYNAVLNIKNRSEFICRLRAAIRSQLGSRFEVHEIDVSYVDPLMPTNKVSYVAMSMKHIKFSYQNEFRLCVVPKAKTPDLGEPIFVNFGPISDISELIPFGLRP
jgi:hypothetical protein